MENDIKAVASKFGKLGGSALRDKYGSDHFRELQKKSVAAKLDKKNSKKQG